MSINLQDYIDYLGLVKCEFNDECDFCDEPTGTASYCSITYGEGYTETNFYICEKCMPEKYRQEIAQSERDLKHYSTLSGAEE